MQQAGGTEGAADGQGGVQEGVQEGVPGEAPPVLVVLQSRGRTVWLALISAAFVAAGVLVPARPGGSGRVWLLLATALFGVCLIMFVVQLVWPGRLVVDGLGITQTALLRTRTFPWKDVENFRVWSHGGTSLVAFDDRRPAGARRVLRALNRSLGAEATLAPGWAMPPEALAAELNAARARWAAGELS